MIADAVERLAHGNAVGVLARVNVLDGEIADMGAGRHHRRRKAGAFFIGPVDEAERGIGLDAGVIQGADHGRRTGRAANHRALERGEAQIVLLHVLQQSHPHRRHAGGESHLLLLE